MNEEIKKKAIELAVLPSYPITDEESQNIPKEELIVKNDQYNRYDCTITNEELLLLTELKKCSYLKTVKNILVAAALVFVANVALTIYVVSKLSSLF